MTRCIAHVALVVREYDEAIAWYTGKLGFTLVESSYQPEQDKRWVVVAPAGGGGTSLRLADAPAEAPFGTAAVFEDLYGNRWDLMEYARGTAEVAR